MSTRPLAVFVGGPPASGKSTLGRALAPALHAALLDLDVATGPLTGVVLDLVGAADLSEPRVAELTREARYETLLALAEDSTRAGTSVVVVAPLRAERSAAGWAAVLERLRSCADAVLVWLTLSPELLTERMTTRGADRDAVKLRAAPAYAAELAAELPTAPHLALDARRPVEHLVADVVAYLSRRSS